MAFTGPVQQSHDACLKVLAKGVHGDTPLISASAKGNYDLTQKLITAGASVNAVNFNGKSTLHHSRNLKCTELLIRTEAKVNVKDNKGYTPLHLTAEFGTIDCCLSLISAGADVNIAANNGETPLIKAAHLAKVPDVEYLLYCGADVNVFDSHGHNALFYAAERGNTGILTLLLEAEADVNAVDSQKKQYSLLIVACKGHDEYVRNLPQARIDRNVTDVDDCNGLRAAARSNHETCLNLLLEAGADVNIIDDGHHALTTAASHGHDTCVSLLLEAGANVNIIDHGDHALTTAASHGHDKCLSLLLETGADVNFCLRFGKAALCSAVGRGDVASTSRLIQKGADINFLNPRNSQSALSVAAYRNRIECLKLLLQAGAHVRITKMDRLPLYVINCVNKQRPIEINREIIRLLQVAGELKEELNEELIHVLGYAPIWDPDRRIAKRMIKKACEYLCDDGPTLCLRNICRRTKREHLLQMSQVNLFARVPHLGLPTSMAKYLLYDVSLDSSYLKLFKTRPTVSISVSLKIR